MNTRYLLDNRMAVRAKDENEAVVILEELMSNRQKLENIRKEIKLHAKADASIKTANLILEMAR
jgi:UDP-N-acetylglucosamine:LPS N-acetylglucosamine transferase